MGKWNGNTSPEDPVADVARQTLQTRLAAVRHYLPLAAEKASEDVEHVHQLRVFSRRATASLRLYADLLPGGLVKWLEKQLRRIRHAANDARDYDVLAQRWAEEHADASGERLLEHVRERRAEGQQRIVAIHERLQRDHCFERRIAKLLRRVRPRGKNKSRLKAARFGDWAHTQLRPLVEKFFLAVPANGADRADLHQFRIRGKDLRYAMELLSGAFPPELRLKLYPIIETLQDKLGEINDHATAAVRLRERLDEEDDPEARNHLRLLLEKETNRFEQARCTFLAGGTARQWEALRVGFEALLAVPTRGKRHRRRDKGLSIAVRGGAR